MSDKKAAANIVGNYLGSSKACAIANARTTDLMSEARDEAFAEGHAQGFAEAFAESGVSERARLGAILRSEEAGGREELAHHLAFKTDLTAPAAIAALATVPATQLPMTDALSAAMTNITNPQVGVGSPSSASTVEAMAEAIVHSYAGGQKQ